MDRPRRLFTLSEAQALLPTVRQLIAEAQEAKRDLDKQTAVLDALMVMAGGNGQLAADITEARRQVRVSTSRLQLVLKELDDTGVEVKGIDEGLVDFPSEREGRIVYLCWRVGEETISWWHELDTGFAGRQPL